MRCHESRNRRNAWAERSSVESQEGDSMKMRLSAVLLALAVLTPPGGAAAQPAQPETREPFLSVTGEGLVRAQPDMAIITLGVVSEAPNAGEALAANNRSMTGILDALRADGLESRDLQTSGFTVDPVYSQPPRDYDGSTPFTPEIVGYRVSNNISVRIRELDRVGQILDRVVTLGANSISGPVFTVADPTPLEDQARRAAVRDALRKGELFADVAGETLGPIVRIEESVVIPPQPLPMGAAMRMEAADASVPIEGGELTFQAHVSVSWRLGE
jgi:uncharacterized protein YggE